MSKTTKRRPWPTWASAYGVRPHTNNWTRGGTMGANPRVARAIES